MEGIYMGQPVYFPPCMTTPDQERQRLQRLPLHCVIEELIAAKARLEVEKSTTMKCFEVFHQDRIRHEMRVMQLTEKVERLKAIQEEERVKWEMRIAQSEAENATLKHNLESGKKEWALKLAEIDKTIISMKEECEKIYTKARQVDFKSKEVRQAKEKEDAAESRCTNLKEANEKMKKEADKWKEKFCATSQELKFLQDKMTKFEDNFKKALLKSRPRLIDLHYLIVQRLPPAARAYASNLFFTLGLNMEFACADDKFQVTTALRRWLECDSSIPRTWGALLVALRRDFHFKEIPPTWVDDITEDLVHGGIAALPGPERFCRNCRRDFSKEHEDDSGNITEAKEESGIPPSEEMVVRSTT